MGLFNKQKVNTRAVYLVDLMSHDVYTVGSKEYKKFISSATNLKIRHKDGFDILLAVDDHVVVECQLLSDAYDIRRKSYEDQAYCETRRKISFGGE